MEQAVDRDLRRAPISDRLDQGLARDRKLALPTKHFARRRDANAATILSLFQIRSGAFDVVALYPFERLGAHQVEIGRGGVERDVQPQGLEVVLARFLKPLLDTQVR